MKRYYIFFGLLALMSVAAIMAQVVMSQPIKADRELSLRLQETNEQIQLYVARQQKLPGVWPSIGPNSLNEVEGDHAGITYKQTGDTTYELCATFQTSSQRATTEQNLPSSYIDAYNHPQGQHCYKLTTADAARPGTKPLPLTD